MDITPGNLFDRWIASLPAEDKRKSLFYTAAIFWGSEGDLAQSFPIWKFHRMLDSETIKCVLAVASPIELAVLLASPLCWSLPNDAFQDWFNVASESTNDLRACQLLAQAAYDRLRKNRSSVTLKPQVVDALCEALDPDMRVIGLKLLSLSSSDGTKIGSAVARMLASDIELDRLAATYVLSECLVSVLKGERHIEPLAPFVALRDIIKSLCEIEDSFEVRENARASLRFLDDIVEGGQNK